MDAKLFNFIDLFVKLAAKQDNVKWKFNPAPLYDYLHDGTISNWDNVYTGYENIFGTLFLIETSHSLQEDPSVPSNNGFFPDEKFNYLVIKVFLESDMDNKYKYLINKLIKIENYEDIEKVKKSAEIIKDELKSEFNSDNSVLSSKIFNNNKLINDDLSGWMPCRGGMEIRTSKYRAFIPYKQINGKTPVYVTAFAFVKNKDYYQNLETGEETWGDEQYDIEYYKYKTIIYSTSNSISSAKNSANGFLFNGMGLKKDLDHEYINGNFDEVFKWMNSFKEV